MAQTKKATEKQTQENENAQDQTNLRETRQTQTPPSRQAGYNQPLHPQELTRRKQPQNQQISSRRQSSPMSPFSFMRRFSEEMDRLFDDFGYGGFMSPASFDTDFMRSGLGQGFASSMWTPQTEVFRRGEKLVVQADLPGMTKDDIKVDIEDDQLIIRGERHSESGNDEEGSYYTERSYGSFYRSIPLPPDIDTNQAKADFTNGVLEITMPLPEQKNRGRRLEIGESGRTGRSDTEKQSK